MVELQTCISTVGRITTQPEGHTVGMTINVVINASTLPTPVTTGSQNAGSSPEGTVRPRWSIGIARPLLTWSGGKPA